MPSDNTVTTLNEVEDDYPIEHLDVPAEQYRAATRRRGIYIALDLLGVLLIAGLVCFVNLSSRPLSVPDEAWEIQASIEMLHGERWWLPTHDGEPWLHKPPLKMWMTWPALQLFPETNFSFRVIDATLGVLLCTVLYFFALSIFSSRLAAWTSVLALLGCDILIRYHGVRSANQDSALTFFSVLAIIAGWKIIHATHDERYKPDAWKARLGWATLGGLAVGAAVLTKSAAGLIALIVVTAFCLLSGRLFQILSRGWLAIAATLGIATLACLGYFLPVCLLEEGACAQYFGENIYARIRSGHGNVNGPWFYLERLFPERGAVPPELLSIGLLFALQQWIWKRREAFGFIAVWAIVPVLCFSFSQTKLSWYIASALPAMALLCGGVACALGAAAVPGLKRWWHKGDVLQAENRLAILGLVITFSLLGVNLYGTAQAVQREGARTRLPVDRVIEDIRLWEREAGRPAKILSFATPNFSPREIPYWMLLGQQITTVDTPESLQSALTKEQFDFVFTATKHADAILETVTPIQHGEFQPNTGRFRGLSVFSFIEPADFHGLSPLKTLLDFGSGKVQTLRGFAAPGTLEGLSVRFIQGDKATFLARGHQFFEKRGGKMLLNMAPHLKTPGEALDLSISLNGKALETLQPKNNRMQTYELSIPPGMLHPGDNQIRFEMRKSSGTAIEPNERILLLNWISLRLEGDGS